MKKYYLLLTLLFSTFCFSQFNPSAPWMSQSEGEITKEKTIDELVSDFDNYWQTHNKEQKGSGYKPFMRWESHWRNKTNEQGYLITPQEMWAAWEQKKQAKLNKSASTTLTAVSNWIPIGPFANAAQQTTRGRGRINIICEDPSNPNTIYFGAPAGGIWKSTNSGTSWTPLSDQLPQIGVSGIAVDYQNPNTLYIATGDKNANDTYSIGVLKSTDGGATWNTTGLSFTNTSTRSGDLVIHPTNNQMLWCATSVGIYRTIDAGATWTLEQTGSFAQGALRLKPNDPSVVYATSNNRFFRSTDSGDTFLMVNSALPFSSGRMIIDVTAANPEYIYCLSSFTNNGFQGLYRSTNGGTTWVNTGLTTATPNIFDGATQAWYDLALCVSQTNPEEVYTGCLNIWKSTNGGATAIKINNWNAYSPSFTHADIQYLKFFGNKLYCGSDGGIYVSTDGGAVFNDIIGEAQIGQFYKISVSKQSASKITGGLQDNGGFIFNNSQWRSYHSGDGMDNAIDPSNSNKCYGFVYNGGTLFISNDSGMTLSAAVPAPTGQTGDWVTPLRSNSIGEIFAGYTNLYKLVAGAWVQQNTSAFSVAGNIKNIAVDPSNNSIMYVSKGAVLYKSTNNGVTFATAYTAPTTITSINVHSSNSAKVYITTAGTGGNAYVSTDGGTSFSTIASGLPAIGKNCIVHQGRNSLNPLYVGTSLGVYYKDDTMSQWEPFDNNLPNVSVADLEINVEDGILIAGTYGRGVWQTAIPVEIPSTDIKFVSIQSPVATINCGGLITPQVAVKNNGTNSISSVTIVYNYNGTPQNFTWNGTIASNATQSINLPSFTLTTRGAYNLTVNTTVANDAYLDNNEGTTPFYINDSGTQGIVNNFEATTSSLLTYTEGLTTSQWQRGTRIGSALATGTNKVYTSNLTGNYPDETKAYLISQCYNFTNSVNPVIRFKMAFQLELNWDIVYVEYSTNFGQNWTVLGAQGTNWYNSNRTNAISGTEDDCQNCPGAQWTGTDTVLKDYFYPLNFLVGNPNVIFRIVFHTDQAVTDLGVIVDDFVIDGTLDNQEFDLKNIAIYPNPSKGIFTVSMGSTSLESIEVYDLTGKIVYSKNEFQANQYQTTLDLSEVTSGIYFVKIESQNQSVTKRIIKN